MKLGVSVWFGCEFFVFLYSISLVFESRSLEDRFLGSLGSLVIIGLIVLLGCLFICLFSFILIVCFFLLVLLLWLNKFLLVV